MSGKRHFLLLQGVCSPFFAYLAQRLQAEGHRVYKLNFNGGDWLYWNQAADNYRGRLDDLPDFLLNLYDKYQITDQILFGDRRPIHLVAITAGRSRLINSHVYEEGYFRPYWITLEREGVNNHSLLPRDPGWFKDSAQRLVEFTATRCFDSTFAIRAIHDVVYHVASAWNPLFYPHYKTHATVSAPLEYLGYCSRLPFLGFHQRQDSRALQNLLDAGTPYFFLPLQLSSDAQIRHYSRFKDMVQVVEFVINSFALHAPSKPVLLIKNHPLDMGLVNYASIIRQLSQRYGLDGRVLYLETGDTAKILQHAAGTVTVNSTVGMQALAHHCPIVTLADPIYNLPGLTFQGQLDDFWVQAQAADADLYTAFHKVVLHTTQVNGGFYSSQGIALAVANSLPVLEQRVSPLQALLN
jgi:capsular polysaccharide export protein